MNASRSMPGKEREQEDRSEQRDEDVPPELRDREKEQRDDADQAAERDQRAVGDLGIHSLGSRAWTASSSANVDCSATEERHRMHRARAGALRDLLRHETPVAATIASGRRPRTAGKSRMPPIWSDRS